MEQMIKALQLLRYGYDFWGYIHAKAIPGASPELVRRMGFLADRMSINVELPSERSLNRLAPDKNREAIFSPMSQIRRETEENRKELVVYKKAAQFAPAGQATQMIIGASPETDYQIITLAAAMYDRYALKRVFYSAYIPAVEDSLLPALDAKPPLLREHRLYQADWLLRVYGFSADEVGLALNKDGELSLGNDPKLTIARKQPWLFPIDINRADYADLIRVPGIGPTIAKKIVEARQESNISSLQQLKKMRVVTGRALPFIRFHGMLAEEKQLAFNFHTDEDEADWTIPALTEAAPAL
jgi:putative DNA modification/repair radical SAM protein